MSEIHSPVITTFFLIEDLPNISLLLLSQYTTISLPSKAMTIRNSFPETFPNSFCLQITNGEIRSTFSLLPLALVLVFP